MSDPTVPPGPPPSSPPPPPSGPTPPPSGAAGSGAPPPPSTPPPTGKESPNRGLMIILSYLGLLALIPFLVEKDDREVQWHAKHGLVLTGLWIVVSIVLAILTSLIAFMDIGCTGCVLHSVLMLVILVVHVMAIVKGLNGQRLILPGISQYADRF
jgi:uncharacterized membrane protein